MDNNQIRQENTCLASYAGEPGAGGMSDDNLY